MSSSRNLAKLRDPFPPNDIEWRIQSCGTGNNGLWAKCLAYITNRAIMERLDAVCGPENWQNVFRAGPQGGTLCGIAIRIDGEWIIKWDGAENTDIEAVKGGLSNAMKRAAVQWGIGRYLYELEEGWANIVQDGQYHAKTKDGKWFRWNPPSLPKWALPGGQQQASPAEPETKSKTNAAYEGFRKILWERLKGTVGHGKVWESAAEFQVWAVHRSTAFKTWGEVESCTNAVELSRLRDMIVAETERRVDPDQHISEAAELFGGAPDPQPNAYEG